MYLEYLKFVQLQQMLFFTKKHKGVPTLLNGCKANTMTLRDASILMNVCTNGSVNHLGEKDDKGKSVLYHTGYTNNDVVGNYLISHINNDDNADKNNLDLMKSLLNHKTCSNDVVNKKDKYGGTALYYAKNNWGPLKYEIIQLLKSKGAV